MILGIDISTKALHLCFYDGQEVEWSRAELRPNTLAGETWFDAVKFATIALVNAFGNREAEEAYIERGWGENRNADYLLGAILGATATALPRVRPRIHVGMMTTHEWKRAVTAAVGVTTKKGVPGNANATKETANSACRIILMEGGQDAERVNRLTPDELDAFGIAWTAHAR